MNTQLDAVEEDSSICAKRLPADTVVLDDIVGQVNSSHIAVVVMEERWRSSSSRAAVYSAVGGRHVSWVFSRVDGTQEVDPLAVKPTLGKQVVGGAPIMSSTAEVQLLGKPVLSHSAACIYVPVLQPTEQCWRRVEVVDIEMVVQILYADNQLANDSCAEWHVLVGVGARLLGINW